MKDSPLEVLVTVCEKPSMYVQGGRYEAVCAYLDGFDAAAGELIGFRQWLLTRGVEWSNLPWWALVRKEVFPGNDVLEPLTDEQSKLLLARLAEVLREFQRARERGGLEAVYLRYFAWLLTVEDHAAEHVREELERDFRVALLGDAKSPSNSTS